MQKITGEKNNREKMPVERIPKPKKKRKPGPENQKIEKDKRPTPYAEAKEGKKRILIRNHKTPGGSKSQ